MQKRSSRSRRSKSFKKFEKFRLHHKIIFSVIGIIGVVAIWRGIWTLLDLTPFVAHPLVAIIIGLILVAAASGFFFKLT